MSRKPITAREKVNSVLYRVFLQFGVYLKDAVTGEDLKPGDDVVFDHTNPASETGTNHWTNLRPLQHKTNADKAKAEGRNCRHVKRIRGEMGAGPKRPIPARPFPAQSRKMQSRPFRRSTTQEV